MMRSRRTLLAVWLGLVAIYAQQPAPVFRSGTKLVEITVTALDRKGNAVAGLEPDDFTILDDGKPRKLALFRFDGAASTSGAQSAGVASLPPGVFTNHGAATGGAPRAVTALALDTLNTPPQQSAVVRAQTMRYLRTLAPESHMAVYLMGPQLRILHDFTDDPAILRAKLEKLTMSMPMANVTNYTQSILDAEAFVNLFAGNPAMQAEVEDMERRVLEIESMSNSQVRRARMERSLAEIEALGLHLTGVPGRKNLVWIGAGISMISISGAMGMGVHGGVESFETQVRRTAQRLAQQGVVLYIVDSKGIELPYDQTAAARMPLPPRGRGRFEPQMDSENASNDPRPAMELMASVTGGRYLHNTNDLTSGFKQTATDLQGSYTLGFYAPDDPDDKWHRLKVGVKRSGVKLRHREGYLAESGPAQPVEWNADSWRAAFSSPVASTAIPLTANCRMLPSGELSLTLSADTNAIQFHAEGETLKASLEISIGDRVPDGSIRTNRNSFTASVAASEWDEARKTGVVYQRAWKPVEHEKSFRVIVHDVRSGQYGALDVPLDKLP
jgi:VWFA-related protein